MTTLDLDIIKSRVLSINDAASWSIDRLDHPNESSWELFATNHDGMIEPLGVLLFEDVADFVANAFIDVPALLARIVELEGERDEARADLSAEEIASCTCQTWPPEGPSPECAVHGAVRAFNSLTADHAKLGQDYVRVMTERDMLRKRLKEEIDTSSTYGHAADDLEKQVNAMRPVVEAAKDWRQRSAGSILGQHEGPLAVAVDVFEGAQPCICKPTHRPGDSICRYRPPADQMRQDGPPGPLSATETAEQGEVIPQWERELLDRQAAAEAEQIDRSSVNPPADGSMIRHAHPNGFRSGQWATIKAVVPADGRECYLVEFPDGVTDFWAIGDPDESYEFGPPALEGETIADGFGNEWPRCGPTCGLEVVRPGKVQCGCDDVRPVAGLDAAIEAAIATGQHFESEPETDDDESYCICGDLWIERHAAEVFVRAAAPHIRRAALEEAADEIEAANCYGESGVIAWLRERAEREGS